jgi:hypothetical protein
MGGRNMPDKSGRGAIAGAILALVAATLAAAPASAQSGEPIKIGFSMALTGGLAPNGKSALLAQKIWEEDINAKGGLLGRPGRAGSQSARNPTATRCCVGLRVEQGPLRTADMRATLTQPARSPHSPR